MYFPEPCIACGSACQEQRDVKKREQMKGQPEQAAEKLRMKPQ
jgi:hypothetical protein